MRKRTFALYVLLILGVGGGGWYGVHRYRDAHSEATRWTALTDRRYSIVWYRYLPPIESLLRAEIGIDDRVGYDSIPVGLAQNYQYVGGWIVRDGETLGSISTMFFYHGWAEEPASAEIDVNLPSKTVALLRAGDLKSLADETRLHGPRRSKFAGYECFAAFDSKGVLSLTLRVAYPSRSMGPVPSPRRADDKARTALLKGFTAFLYREAVDQRGGFYLWTAPVYTAEHDKWVADGGRASGFIQVANLPYLSFTLESKGSQLEYRVLSEGLAPFPDSAAAKLYTPRFLKGGRFEGGLVIERTKSPNGGFGLKMTCPIDFPLEDTHLDKLAMIGSGR